MLLLPSIHLFFLPKVSLPECRFFAKVCPWKTLQVLHMFVRKKITLSVISIHIVLHCPIAQRFPPKITDNALKEDTLLQRLYRIITSEELVSPHHSAREMIDMIKDRDFTKLFQKNVKKVSFLVNVYGHIYHNDPEEAISLLTWVFTNPYHNSNNLRIYHCIAKAVNVLSSVLLLKITC